MLRFDVYAHETHGYEAVKRGFSWPAFLLGIFWAFYKKLWLAGSIYLLVILLLALPGDDLSSGGLGPIYDFVGFGISLFVGIAGNGWRRQLLTQQGYRFVDAIEARSPQAAIEALVRPGQGGATA